MFVEKKKKEKKRKNRNKVHINRTSELFRANQKKKERTLWNRRKETKPSDVVPKFYVYVCLFISSSLELV